MGAKNYKHIAIEDDIARSFDDLKNNLKKIKRNSTDTDAMKILLAKNQKIVLPKDDIIKILLDPDDDEN